VPCPPSPPKPFTPLPAIVSIIPSRLEYTRKKYIDNDVDIVDKEKSELVNMTIT
jgi:hypothetical protein